MLPVEAVVVRAATPLATRLVEGIRREAIRLCGIRQEPLESWIKDADDRIVPELRLNSWLMAEAFLQLLATGIGALILVSASAVVLGGFSTKIKKEDFWYITAIGIIQTAKVVGSISGPTLRFFVQYPAAPVHKVISTWIRRGHEFVDLQTSMMLPSILFAAAPMITAAACLTLSIIGLVGAVRKYGGSDTYTTRGNMKPALIVFYSLVLAQGTLFYLWFGVIIFRSYHVTQEFSRKYFGNTNGEELVDRYITETQDKCIEKGVFGTTNRTLVSFAAELLQSEHRSDHVSAVSVLHVLTTRAERAAGVVKQISSSEQVVGSLFKLLRAQSPLDLGTKAETAEILTKVACNLRLTDIPGAAHSISSLLEPHPRLMKTAALAGQQEPPAPGVAHQVICNEGCRWLLTELKKCMGLGAKANEAGPPGETPTQTNNSNQGGAEPQSRGEVQISIDGAQDIQNQTTNTNEGGARDKPLIVHGLMILDELASDPGNCTEICKTTDLVPKILAPLRHGLLNILGNNDPKTIQIVKASLRVLAKLTSGTCESSSNLRRELTSENGRTARNIMWIMRNSSEQEMRILAVEILTRLTLGQPRMRGFFDPQDSPPAGTAQSVLAVDLRSWEVICQEVGDQFSALVELMNADGTSMEHRAVTAEFLAQICAKSKTDQDRMNRLSSISNSLSKVLEAIVNAKIKDMTDERRKFLASFLCLAVQIRENNLVTAEAFAQAVRELRMGDNFFCPFQEKLKDIIVEMTKESEDIICLVITKAATKLLSWTMMSIDPDYAHYYQKIVYKLNDSVNAMGDLERCVVLRGDADEKKPYETLQTLVEELKSCLVAVLSTAGQHHQSDCHNEAVCYKCRGKGHIAADCRALGRSIKLFSFGIPGQGFYAMDFAEEKMQAAKSTGVIIVHEGEATEKMIDMELKNLVQEGWDFKVRQLDAKAFLTIFPDLKSLESFSKIKGSFELSVYGLKVSLEKSFLNPMSSSVLHTIWVKIHNVSGIVREVEAVKELAALVAEPLVVDELSLVKDEPVRVKVRCRKSEAINGDLEVFFNGEGIFLKFEVEERKGMRKGFSGGRPEVSYASMIANVPPFHTCCRPITPPQIWGRSDDCPENFENGKFMLTLGEIMEEAWETKRFHVWYMEAAKAGLKDFTIRIPADLFHMVEDGQVIVEFRDMHRLLRRVDLDIQQVTIFAMMQAYIAKVTNNTTVFLNPQMINERTLVGYDIPDNSSELTQLKTEAEKQKFRKDARIDYIDRASMYMLLAMREIQKRGSGCILAAHQFGMGMLGHWVTFVIFPQDGRAIVLDSLRKTNPQGYKEFESCLRSAYMKYLLDPNCFDQRSQGQKDEQGNEMIIEHDYPCHKQPEGSLTCGFYTCEYLRVCAKQEWHNYKVDPNFSTTVADICKFVTEAALEGRDYLHPECLLAMDPKYEKIRNWNDKEKGINIHDYAMSDLFSAP